METIRQQMISLLIDKEMDAKELFATETCGAEAMSEWLGYRLAGEALQDFAAEP